VPQNPTGFVRMFADDGFELSCDNISDYLHTDYNSTIFILTNKPVPIPPEPIPGTRTNAQKRQDAYEKGGYDGEKCWYIEWNKRQYTCDNLTQLGMRYEFKEETETFNAIKVLVEAKITEIREYYPDEDEENIEDNNGEVK